MNIERNKVIAENIRSFIRSKNITQKELADAIKISPSTLSDYLNLRSNPSHGVIQKIADYFEVGKSDIDTTFKDASEYSLTSKVANIMNSLTPPRQHNVLNYAENQLDEQNGIVKLSGYIKEDIPEYTTSSLYGSLSAGTGQQIFDNPIEEVEIPTSIIPNESYDIMLKIVGDSMQPAFECFTDSRNRCSRNRIETRWRDCYFTSPECCQWYFDHRRGGSEIWRHGCAHHSRTGENR